MSKPIDAKQVLEVIKGVDEAGYKLDDITIIAYILSLYQGKTRLKVWYALDLDKGAYEIDDIMTITAIERSMIKDRKEAQRGARRR